jgi:glyoxylate/hydroxypyruvate reductase A
MKLPIAFVSRADKASEEQWIKTLSTALPNERILAYGEMSPDEREASEFAIVANPDPQDIANLPKLKWMHSLWAGVEKLVAELGETAPPIVRLVDTELSRVMAEAILAWTHYLQRDMPAYRAQQSQGFWKELDYRHPNDMTVGVLGLGELGTEATKYLTRAGFNVTGWSRSQKTIDGVTCLSGTDGLATLFATSDIIACVVPLTPETRGLINAEALSKMKQGTSIINFARGAVIVADDLLAALDSGHIDHAVLDVFEQEPLDGSSRFWSHPRVTVLPHISAPTKPETSAAIVAKNYNHWRATGELPTTVDMSRGY